MEAFRTGATVSCQASPIPESECRTAWEPLEQLIRKQVKETAQLLLSWWAGSANQHHK